MEQKNGQKSAGTSGNPIGCLLKFLLWTTIIGLGAWVLVPGLDPREAVKWGLGGAVGVTVGGLVCLSIFVVAMVLIAAVAGSWGRK